MMAKIKGKNPGCGDAKLPTGNCLISSKVIIDNASKIMPATISVFLISNFYPFVAGSVFPILGPFLEL